MERAVPETVRFTARALWTRLRSVVRPLNLSSCWLFHFLVPALTPVPRWTWLTCADVTPPPDSFIKAASASSRGLCGRLQPRGVARETNSL